MKFSFFLYGIFFIFNTMVCDNQYRLQKDFPEPYQSINILPFDPHGWFSPCNRKMLEKFIKENDVNTIIEIGSWLGSSAIFMAKALVKKNMLRPRLYAIDHWMGGPSQANMLKLKYLFQQFLSNVIHHDLAHVIVPIRMNSLEAAAALNIYADLIYIDGSHDINDVYNDIIAWNKHLSHNGIICGDDWNAVKQGVSKAAFELNKKIKTEGNIFWYLSKS